MWNSEANTSHSFNKMRMADGEGARRAIYIYRQHSQVHRQIDVLDGNQYQAEIIVAGARQHKQ